MKPTDPSSIKFKYKEHKEKYTISFIKDSCSQIL